jgi:hypothetical protein
MFPFRSIFPSFERPVPPPRYLNIRPEGRGIGRKIGALMAGCLAVGIALAQFDGAPPAEGTALPVMGSAATAQFAAPAEAMLAATPAIEKPRKITPVVCGQKASVRRDCADIRAAREAKLAPQLILPETSATVLAPARPGAAAEQIATLRPETPAVDTVLAAEAMAAATPAAAPASPPARAAARQKPKKVRVPADDPPVERLVHIYDQIAPDGRRVPVYRRNDGGYETGTIVGDEYRASRRVNLEPPRGQRYFGLQ